MTRIDPSLIAEFGLFEGLSREQLAWVVGEARAQRVPQNQHVFNQGEAAHSFFLILDGHVRAVRTTPDGDQVVVRYFSTGDPIGIAHAIGRDSYPASAIAAVDCVVLAWPTPFWPKLVTEIPAFGLNASREIGARLTQNLDRVIEMSTEQVERRVARAVLRLVQQTGRKTDDGLLIDFPITRQDIAEMTGTTLHTVSRLLSAWEQAGLVKSSRQKVVVVEPHQLFLIAEGHRRQD